MSVKQKGANGPGGAKTTAIVAGAVATTVLVTSLTGCVHPKHFGDPSPRTYSSEFKGAKDRNERKGDAKKNTPPRSRKEYDSNAWTLDNFYAYYKHRGFETETDSGCKPIEYYHPALFYAGGEPFVSTEITFRGSEDELKRLRAKVEIRSEGSTNSCGSTTLNAVFPLAKLQEVKGTLGIVGISQEGRSGLQKH